MKYLFQADLNLILFGAIIGAILSLIVYIVIFLFQYFIKAFLDERKARTTAMQKLLIEINSNLLSINKYLTILFHLLDDVLVQLMISGEINLFSKFFEDQLHNDIMMYRDLLNLFNQGLKDSTMRKTLYPLCKLLLFC